MVKRKLGHGEDTPVKRHRCDATGFEGGSRQSEALESHTHSSICSSEGGSPTLVHDPMERSSSTCSSDTTSSSGSPSEDMGLEPPISNGAGTSSSGDSSRLPEASSEEDESAEIAVPSQAKPGISRISGSSDLRSRLASFLPQMKAANDELDDPGRAAAKRIDEVGDGEERYIEMDLGLGVLKELRRETGTLGVGGADVRWRDNDDDESSTSSEEDGVMNEDTAEEEREQIRNSHGLFDELVGSKMQRARRPIIQDLDYNDKT